MGSRWKQAFLPALVLCVFASVASASDGGGSAQDTMHRMMLLVIQLGMILFAAKLGNILFGKLHLPGVLGELMVGVVIGPFCLGGLAFYGFDEGMFPSYAGLGVSPELYGLCVVASVVLMLTIGLETDLRLLARYSLAGVLTGIGGVVASFFFGAGLVVLFSPALFGEQLGLFATPCLFMAIVTAATSVGITATILSERGKIDSPEGVTIMSAAVIDDVIGIVALAVVMGVASASRAGGVIDWRHIGTLSVKAVGFWLAATVIGILASRRISFLLKWFGERTSMAIMALGLALIVAGLFEEVGLAMIIGAYVIGLSLSQADISHVVRENLRPIYVFLVPVFFCVTGMRIDLTTLGSRSMLLFGLCYSLVALAAKVIGCGGAALLADFNWRGALRIGFGMAPRGEVGLIIAGIALTQGLISPPLFAAAIMMVLFNTLFAPVVLGMLFNNPARGTRKPVSTEDKIRTEVFFELPSMETVEFMAEKLSTIFESEGFFVHLLGRERLLYHLRKDGTIIDFHAVGTRLTFHCRQSDVPLINTAMVEAVAALEQAINGLKKPLDMQAIATRIQQDQGDVLAPTMALQDYLTPRLIEPELKGTTKGEIINELLGILDQNGLLGDPDQARQAVWDREQSMSTGLQYGLAIPHGKTDSVKRLVCAVGVRREGVDFDAADGRPSTIFVLTLSPTRKPAPHVQFMSAVSQVLNSGGRRRILDCRSADEIFSVLVSGPKPALRERPARIPFPVGGVSKFRLGDYLRPEFLEPDLKGETKEAVIDELLSLLEAQGVLHDVAAARRAVLERESQMPTALSEGVAIPHGRTNAVDLLVCAAGVKRDGVDFGSTDGKPTKIIVMALTSESGSDPYLQLMAAVIAALDTPGRERVLAATTREELYDALIGER